MVCLHCCLDLVVSRNNEGGVCVYQSKVTHIMARGREGEEEEEKGEGHTAFQHHVLSDLTFSTYALSSKTSTASPQCHLLRTSSSTHEHLVDVKIPTFKSYNPSSRKTEDFNIFVRT